uniref:Uncharacterized protein n=1 Tax=Triticum urartu TaxID=4572 RepID=A0A8R7UEI6_TRIUA
MVHSMVTAELSVPPAMMSWTKALTPSRVSLASVDDVPAVSPSSSASCSSTSTKSLAAADSPWPVPVAIATWRRSSSCSSRILSRNRSYTLLNLFILRTQPCTSSHPSHGTHSPTLLTAPVTANASSSVRRNSSPSGLP